MPTRQTDVPRGMGPDSGDTLLIYVATFALALCSIVYELLLGQTLSAFLGNTVLRFSVTIGLYMLAMGAGAMAVRGRLLERPLLALQRVELGLTLLGGLSVVSLFVVDSWGAASIVISILGHGYIIVIGVLTGLELPLLVELAHRRDDTSRNRVLGVDYLGAFVGTLVFAFWFYPHAGLIPTALLVATLNAAVGVSLIHQFSTIRTPRRTPHLRIAALQIALLLVGVYCISNAGSISEHCIDLYLGAHS